MFKTILLFCALGLVLVLPVAISSGVRPQLPFKLPDEQIRPLRQLVDPSLQILLERRLKQNKKWARLISRKKMAVGLVDLRDPYHIKFARVNGDVMMYAASLPKLAILLAASQAIEDETLEPTPAVLNDMRIMISRSDNHAATRMINRLGFENIESVLTCANYELYDVNNGGGLWVGRRYAKRSTRYPDPLMGISHGASVTQVCRFYYMLAMGKLVSEKESMRMLDILSDPEINHKFVRTLEMLAPNARLYRKSGTWRNWHSDSVMVWGPVWRRYIVVGLVEDPNGEYILRNLIPVVEEVLRTRTTGR
jgi:beta-lactamase class A